MKVEIWSDIVCPWCYIGKRRFEQALAAFAHAEQVEVTWRSFELDPSAPASRPESQVEHLASKYGVSVAEAEAMNARMTAAAAGEGLDYRLDIARSGSSFDAHRVLHLAAERGVQDAVKERLLAGYLCEGEPIGDHVTLARLAGDAGIDADEAAAVLSGDRFADAVRADEADGQRLGITGVPFFVVDRTYGVSGAQPADVLVQVLDRAWSESHPLTVVGAPDTGDACADGSCAI